MLGPPTSRRNSRCQLVCSPRFLLATLPDSEYRLHVSSFVDRSSAYFDPGMCFEGELLCSHYHLGAHAAIAKQACGNRRALQAEGAFRVPNTCVINRIANAMSHLWW